MAGEGIAQRWKELSGEHDWKGLLEPLDIDLRRYIIHYGERAGASSSAFIREEGSKWYRFSRYPPQVLFSSVGLEIDNPYKYTVTSFFYASADFKIILEIEKESSWMGFVAVATDEGKTVLGRRDILVSWRGTETNLERWDDVDFLLSSASDIFGDSNHPNVQDGFLTIYTAKNPDCKYNKISAREQVLREVKKLVDQYQDEEISITVTGHSLGSALATLNAMDIVANRYNRPSNGIGKACPVAAIVFASPRVGDEGFKRVYSTLDDLHILRITNINDKITDLPPKVFAYVDVGVELTIDRKKSPYLNEKASPHNLELYLHTVAGTQGIEGDFQLAVPRSISLVNKSMDGLKDEYKVPVNWWVKKNKTMVQHDDGSWELDHQGYAPLPDN
ncbi:Phospholipase A1 [Melia azedarach]|uniref:Phospholipase A1 n=1 Tax=Melia azedarach TaxID=155640 RepID=A0ACC1WXJ6_MELAZ|nr:Phospholipase A1 [Melia azedarach]